MNVFSGIGRIGRDAEVRHTKSGKEVTGWPVAIDAGFGDKKTTTWIECTLWGDRGPKLAEYLRKGDRVGVTGEISLETFQGNDGTDKSKVRLNVRDVTLLGEKRDSTPQRQQAQQQRPATPPPADDFADDEIPF